MRLTFFLLLSILIILSCEIVYAPCDDNQIEAMGKNGISGIGKDDCSIDTNGKITVTKGDNIAIGNNPIEIPLTGIAASLKNARDLKVDSNGFSGTAKDKAEIDIGGKKITLGPGTKFAVSSDGKVTINDKVILDSAENVNYIRQEGYDALVIGDSQININDATTGKVKVTFADGKIKTIKLPTGSTFTTSQEYGSHTITSSGEKELNILLDDARTPKEISNGNDALIISKTPININGKECSPIFYGYVSDGSTGFTISSQDKYSFQFSNYQDEIDAIKPNRYPKPGSNAGFKTDTYSANLEQITTPAYTGGTKTSDYYYELHPSLVSRIGSWIGDTVSAIGRWLVTPIETK